MRHVTKRQARRLIGKSIYAVRKDGTVVKGKLIRIHQNKLIMAPLGRSKGKAVRTNFFLIPLLLFDLLVIGTLPFWGFGGGFCGCGGFGCAKCGFGGKGYPGGGYFNGY